MTHGVVALIGVVSLTGVAAVACTLDAQSPRPIHEPAEIQRRLDKSVELQREALEGMADVARAKQLVKNAQLELQAARSAMAINATGAKFPDPLFDLNNKRTQEALALLQQARHMLRLEQEQAKTTQEGERPGPHVHLEVARDSLERAFRITRLVLAF